MTKAKKAISLIVSVVMLLGVLAVGVFANDNTGVAENGTIALSFDKASYSAGDTVKVTVKLTTDYMLQRFLFLFSLTAVLLSL